MAIARACCVQWAALLVVVVSGVVGESAANVDVLIVGAGQAGMAAAHRLGRLGYSVQVLEATDHVGGRTRNYDVGTMSFDNTTDDAIEVGGTWFSPNHTAALELCSDLNIEVFNASFVDRHRLTDTTTAAHVDYGDSMPWWYWGPDYPEDQMAKVQDVVFHSYEGRFAFRNTSGLFAGLQRSGGTAVKEMQQAGTQIDQAAAAISSKCWNETSVSAAWRKFDAYSTGSYVGPMLKSEEAKQMLRNTIHDHNAQEPEAVSFLYNLMSFKGCNSGGPDDQLRVRGGTQAIPLAIAAQLGKNVSLLAQVREIHTDAKGIHAQTADGQRWSARMAIVTGPPTTLMAIDFQPPLKAPQAQLLQRMPMGTSLKYMAVYKQGPWWRKEGFQGDILATRLPAELSLPGIDSNIPLFVQCVDHSPYSLRFGVICCFVEGRQNMYFMGLPEERQRSLMTSFLQHSFNDSRAVSYEPSFIAHNWADQPFARGAYTGFFSTGVQSVPEFWDAYREMEKLPNVLFAGADYHTGFGNGYIEGGIRDGQRAAEYVHSKLATSIPRAETLVV